MSLSAWKKITSGTVTNAAMTATLTAGSADIDFGEVTQDNIYHLLRIWDSAGKSITGCIGINGTGTVSKIFSTCGGSTQSWTGQSAGFNTDDEAGYTYAIYRSKTPVPIATGTATAGNAVMDTTSTNAFIAPVGVDLTAYQTGKYLAWSKDSSNVVAYGFIKSGAPGGETLDATNIHTNGTFDSDTGWTLYDGFSISDGVLNINAPAYSAATQLTNPVAGGCYKTTMTFSLSSGSVYEWFSGGPAGMTKWVNGDTAKYLTAPAANVWWYLYTQAETAVGATDAIVTKKLTDCAATGAYIISAKGGATRAWTSKGSGFDANKAQTYKIFYVPSSPTIVATGSITAGNALYDTTSTNAFAAPVGLDLSSYQTGHYMYWTKDSSGKVAYGYIRNAAPGGETYSLEQNGDPGFADSGYWLSNDVGWSVSGGKLTATSVAVDKSNYKTGVLTTPTGKLYMATIDVDSITGGSVAALIAGLSSTGVATTGTHTFYKTSVGSGTIGVESRGAAGFSGQVDNLHVYQLTDCAAIGAHIVSTQWGSTRSWAYQDAGFDGNKAQTIKIYYVGS